jgi:hypothetical protein
VLLVVPASTTAGAERSSVLVQWSDPEGAVSATVLDSTARETEALFARWGVRLRLARGSAGGEDGRPPIRIILMDRSQPGYGRPKVLGRTKAAPQASPVVWILVPNVREILKVRRRGGTSGELARALARVTAHEVVHVLAPGLEHSSGGLMGPRLRPDDLVHPTVPGLSDAFRGALLEAVEPAAAARPQGGPHRPLVDS